MYAKLVNGTLKRAPKSVKHEGKIILNPSEDIWKQLGYYPVIYTEMPTDVEEGNYYSSYWEQTEEAIVQKWKLEVIPKIPEIPTDGERLDALEQAMLELAEVMADG